MRHKKPELSDCIKRTYYVPLYLNIFFSIDESEFKKEDHVLRLYRLKLNYNMSYIDYLENYEID